MNDVCSIEKCGRRATVAVKMESDGTVIEFCELHYGAFLVHAVDEVNNPLDLPAGERFSCKFRGHSFDLAWKVLAKLAEGES